MRAKKCISKIITNTSRTRSSSKTKKNEDVFMYILESIGDTSDSDIDITLQKPEPNSKEQIETETCSVETTSSPVKNVENENGENWRNIRIYNHTESDDLQNISNSPVSISTFESEQSLTIICASESEQIARISTAESAQNTKSRGKYIK
ncbi:hypothetical protein CEXT_178081 [Caerostris extrusa]|uniref:Uncharacterized protein n=1 Tax=Caerostris extrusa TaxID=172846 RepID=A0AAV4NT36_CAEEX|nr:hypothetical protein CEXT_178081 [Caerostris extrusa]